MESEPLALQSVHRALDILEAVSVQKDGLGVTAIARQLGLKIGTTGNILKVLKVRGYVDQLPDSHYILGSQMIAMAGRGLGQIDLGKISHEPLQALHEYCGETVFLGVRKKDTIYNLTIIDGIHPLMARVQPGSGQSKARNLHCTAMGKILLSNLSEPMVDAVLAETGLPPKTPHTITDMKTLKLALNQVRNQGFAYNCEEETVGVCGIAAPVYDNTGFLIAGVCVGYPSENESRMNRAELVEKVKTCALEISMALGYIRSPA
jgi:IclR family transcriptional regulator, KDG regulon repressor